ncbi:hypothetical protein L2E82_44847 [Cichorium intybus]|uniref:Uncharacterized protein n=1 Tax=Cichorium intybus TaxID=13427 RepID=A0ACB8ZSC7_CICIN|nr:hypothetical protein L2E82_44847 [Cichorium intybus]
MASFLLNTLRNPSVFASSSSSSNGSLPVSGNQVSQSGKGGPVIIELPLNQIRRPLMRTRANDPQKVQELMDSIAQIGLQVPIDVLEVDGAYYGFSGCHRYEAHQRLGLPTIRCKIRRGTKETLSRILILTGITFAKSGMAGPIVFFDGDFIFVNIDVPCLSVKI